MTDSLVGRRVELSALRDALDGAREGRGGVVVVAGAAGVGKTRLAAELAVTARERGVEVVTVRAGDADAAANLDLLRDRPTLLCVEEYETAAPTTVEAVVRLAARAHAMPVLVLALQRTGGPRAHGAADDDVDRYARHIRLDGLSDEDVAALAEQVVRSPPTAAEVRDLQTLTGGNPRFVTELLAPPLGRDALRDPDRARVPDGVRAAVRVHVAALDDDSRAALEAAALDSTEITVGSLAAMLRDDPSAGLDVLQREGLVVRAPDGTYRIRDGLTRLVVEEDVPPDRRIDLHRRAARALDAAGGPGAERVAHHLLEAAIAGDASAGNDAACRAREAVEASLARGDWVTARRFASRLRVLLPDRDPGHVEALLALGRAEEQRGAPDAARVAFRGAAELARGAGDGRAAARAALGLASTWSEATAGHPEVIHALEQALHDVADTDPLSARLLGRLAQELHYAPDRRDEAGTLSRAAIDLAHEVGDTAVALEVLHARHAVLAGPDDLEERSKIADELGRRARDTDHTRMLVQALFWSFGNHLERGDRHAADATLAAYARLVEVTGDTLHRSRLLLQRAALAQLEGRLDEADRLCGEARAAGRSVGNATTELLCDAHAWTTRYLHGRTDEVDTGTAGALGGTDAFPVLRCVNALTDALAGRVDRASVELQHHVADGFSGLPRDGYWLAGLALLAEVAVRLDDADSARALYETLVPYGDHTVVVGRAAVSCWGSAERTLGALAVVTGDHALAREHLERAADTNLRLRAWPWLSDTRAHLAGLGAEAARRDRPVPAVEAPTAALRRTDDGLGWTLEWRGVAARAPHRQGLVYLVELLRRPGVPVHASTLAAAADGTLAFPSGDAGPAVDRRAVAEYRARLRALREDLELRGRGAADGVDLSADDELAWLSAELSASLDRAGRPRRSASSQERARKSVTNAIRRAIAEVALVHAPLGAHLANSVRTGTTCEYSPEPPAPVWTT